MSEMSDTVKDLLLEGYQALHNSDIEKAYELSQNVLQRDPKNPLALDFMGLIFYEMNNTEDAHLCFLASVTFDNSRSHFPYLYLAQMCNGEESANYFLKSIDLMKSFNNKEELPEFLHPTKVEISNAYVSLAELYMTDLCDVVEAEEKCKEYIQNSIDADDENSAVWQCDAGYKLILNKKDEACESIKKSLNLWLPKALEIIESNKNNDENNVTLCCEESTELRSKCAEILYELNMFKELESVLETILYDDEDFFQAHYLMAMGLDRKLENETIDISLKQDIINRIVNFADSAIEMADPELENEAICNMEQLLEKYSNKLMECNNELEDESEDDSDDDSDGDSDGSIDSGEILPSDEEMES